MAEWFCFGKSNEARKARRASCLLAVCLSASALNGETQPLRATTQQSASAVLHINVLVVPIVQTPQRTVTLQSPAPITYSFGDPPLSEQYEIRNLPPEEQSTKSARRAIVKTLVVVPR